MRFSLQANSVLGLPQHAYEVPRTISGGNRERIRTENHSPGRDRGIDAEAPERVRLRRGADPYTEEAEKIEDEIRGGLSQLYVIEIERFSSEIQEEEYFVAQEAEAGKDRELALVVLQDFLARLEEEKEK